MNDRKPAPEKLPIWIKIILYIILAYVLFNFGKVLLMVIFWNPVFCLFIIGMGLLYSGIINHN